MARAAPKNGLAVSALGARPERKTSDPPGARRWLPLI
jgi:hypothetical protein